MKYKLAFEDDSDLQLVSPGSDTYDPPAKLTNLSTVKQSAKLMSDIYNKQQGKSDIGKALIKGVHSISDFEVINGQLIFSITHGRFSIDIVNGLADAETVKFLEYPLVNNI